MFLKVLWCLYINFLFFGVRSQKAWEAFNSGYNTGFSNSWNQNNAFSSMKNKNPFPFNYNNNAGSWSSDGLFNNKPNDNSGSLGNKKKPDRTYEIPKTTENTSGWNSNKRKKTKNEISSAFVNNKRPNEKKLGLIMNPPSSSSWNTNSNKIPSDTNPEKATASNWGSNNFRPSAGQNSRPQDWNFNNNINNKPSDNSDSDYEENSLFPSWSSNDKKKPEQSFNSFGDINSWESTTKKNKKPGTSKWETNNVKPQKPSTSSSWNPNTTIQPGREKTPTYSNENKPSVDLSILDELDKNEWYFGKESNYPKPPFRSALNIDVSELWNFDKNKKSNQNSRNSNSSYSRRRNRQIERRGGDINCMCVKVDLCEEEDMIITREDLRSDMRPLKEFMCTDLTEVCCTDPKIKLSSEGNSYEEKEQLQCGQRRLTTDSFERIYDNTAELGEFPWELKIKNSKVDCSASLIHHKLALTAAHCVIGNQPDELTLRAGIWNSNDESSQSRKVTKIILHPDYNSQNPRNDIALLVLETPFKLTDNVNTICLPVTNDKWDSNQCVVSTWKSEETFGQVLEKGVVNFLPQAECQNIMLVTDLWRNYILHDSFMCGMEKTGQDSCTGNEGGVVACPSKKHQNTYLQIGIVSKGMNCDNFGRPGIFTNVLMFVDWINENYFELELPNNTDLRDLE